MSECIRCETQPVATFDGNGLCAEHADQWVEVTTRHAPLTSGPMPKINPQRGLSSHTPRHYK